MTIAVAQETGASNSASGSTITVAFVNNCTPGSTFHVAGSNDTGGGVDISGFSDSVNGSYGANTDDINDSGNAQRLAHAKFINNASAVKPTVTCTFSAATTFRGVAIKEITGATTGAMDTHHAQVQAAVGTGTDAITAGAVANSAQPALASGFTLNTGNNTTTAATGTGYTTGIGTWSTIYGGSTNRLFTESKRLTTTTSQAATYTASLAGSNWVTAMAVFDEAAASAGLDDDDCGDWPMFVQPQALN